MAEGEKEYTGHDGGAGHRKPQPVGHPLVPLRFELIEIVSQRGREEARVTEQAAPLTECDRVTVHVPDHCATSKQQ
eukprot:453646-Prorocentrum_minimum.AAC.1